MTDPVQWLRAQLDDDERVARATGDPGEWTRGPVFDGDTTTIRDHNDSVLHDGTFLVEDAEHIVRWDPARVLADVDARRRILDFLNLEWNDGPVVRGPEDETGWMVVRLLKLPYADRLGYQDGPILYPDNP